ncbi:hypothetical protein VPMG_00071 [Vibrio phage VBP32]|uniref:DUF2730 family protein n=2 Tax=Stoningtonvirus VBP47 TaxID=2846606 RepID=M4SL58_9CAUD|nr:hypothetical protein VPNG_00058 [Vibrio phage VBP47]YP_007676561.1 hypothetical protein VPMG_00071 [Vibrio phage VBP32]AGH57082.1 hypothetical protein VPNG_00058 [Vibrio phage VBP47]AGH57210.1 hypothetical protein VPMG_00071 [Vibrio phage VBP32]
MGEWIRNNAVALCVLIGSWIAVYSSIQSDLATDRVQINELKAQVNKLDSTVEPLPALVQDVRHLEDEVQELKPIMSDLAKGVNKLNVTLAKIEGKLENK